MAANRDTPTQGLALDTTVIRQHLSTMNATLSSIEPIFDTLNQQSGEVTGLIPTTRATSEQINNLHEQILSQDRKSNTDIEKFRQIAREKLQDKIAGNIKPGILKKIKAEISHQISQEVAVQIREHLPVSLKEQVAESNKQVEELTASLKNSEARRNNATLRFPRGYGVALAPVLKPSGGESVHFPTNLKALFLYDLNKSKALVTDYGLPKSEKKEENFTKFMSHIGIQHSEIL